MWGKQDEALPKKSFVFKMKYVAFALKNICDFFNYENLHLWGKRNEAFPLCFVFQNFTFALKKICDFFQI